MASRILPGYARLHSHFVQPFVKTQLGIDFETYARVFSAKGSFFSGDITPGYSTLRKGLIRRIMNRFPATKVVYIVRDPVERLWSALLMHVRKGRRPWPFDRETINGLLREGNTASRTYQTQVASKWRQFVPEHQFGLFIFDDLVADTADFRNRIVSFLGGDPTKPSGSLPIDFNRKSTAWKEPLPDELRELLAHMLEDELRASAEDFGGTAASWPGRYGL